LSLVCHEADSPRGVKPHGSFVVRRKRVPNLDWATVKVQNSEASVPRDRNQAPLGICRIHQSTLRHGIFSLARVQLFKISCDPPPLPKSSPGSMFVKSFSGSTGAREVMRNGQSVLDKTRAPPASRDLFAQLLTRWIVAPRANDPSPRLLLSPHSSRWLPSTHRSAGLVIASSGGAGTSSGSHSPSSPAAALGKFVLGEAQ
jgi:hypothetical protein